MWAGERFRSWFYPGFTAFVSSQFVSLIGDRAASLAFVSLVASVVSQDKAGAAASNIAVIQILPIFLFSYFGGWLSDRLPRKWLMWWVDVLRLLTVFVFLPIFAVWPNIYSVYVTVFVLGTMTAFFNPAKRSFIPFLVPMNTIRQANWWVVLTEVVAMGGGIGLGTLLLKYFPPSIALIGDALTFLVALFILFSVPSNLDRGAAGETNVVSFEDLKMGLSYLRGNRALLIIIFVMSVPFYFACGLYYAAANHWAVEVNPTNAGYSLGLILMAIAMGSLLSFLLRGLIEQFNEMLGAAIAFFAGAAFALPLGLIGANSNQYVILCLSLLFGISVGLIYARSVYMIHMNTESWVVGRVISINEIFTGLAVAVAIGVTSALGPAFSAPLGWAAAAGVFAISGLAMYATYNKRSSE